MTGHCYLNLKRMKSILFLLALQLAASLKFAHAKSSSKLSKPNLRHISELKMSDDSGGAAVLASAPAIKGGESTIASSTFNLAKSVVGCGVLSLPSGIAFFSDAPGAVLPASIICAAMGVLSGYSFSIIGRACEQHGVTSFQDVWAKSVDEKSAWMLSASITTMCFLACLAYSIIIGDSFSALASTFQLPPLLATRGNVIVALTVAILYPLCSLKSLAALSPFSLMGLGGTLYTALFMAIRVFDGSYAKGGRFFEKLSETARPVFGTKGPWSFNNNMWVLVSMLSTSFIAHYNAPKFYSDLKEPSMANFNKVVKNSFAIAICAFVVMMSMGFLTFGGTTAGFVLNNYAGNDMLATLARLAIGLALLTGYPFTFTAMRDGVFDLAKANDTARAKWTRPLNVALISVVTVLAILLKDVGFVVSLSGALFGTLLMFMVPSYMNIQNIKKRVGAALTKNNKMEIAFNYFTLVLGSAMGALGVAISVLSQMGKL